LSNLTKNLIMWVVIAMVLVAVFNTMTSTDGDSAREIDYSTFVTQVHQGNVAKVRINGSVIEGRYHNGGAFSTYSPGDPQLVNDLLEKGVSIDVEPPEKTSLLVNILISWFPLLLLVGIWIFFMRQMQGGGGRPGTGKTLLAKAIAGEAKVPFYSVSGSDFVEMFVGVGASRVRDMFEQAKKNPPCIIFIDEIDAVGRQRGAGLGGGHDEREQTLNQLLVEMDGFEGGEGIIIIAATNRPDVLDPALLRPGRFDRQVHVPLPDIRGREKILQVHMRKVPVADDVDTAVLARGTPGFSGADLANLINEAALFAARSRKRRVTMREFELAKDKVVMGVERRSIVMPEEERRNTAYHESGHAVVAKVLEHADPVHKVTIIPRGRALGVTMQLPEQDRYSHNRGYLYDKIAVLMGGRIAEELFMNQMTTGASNDFEVATDIAHNMVARWGMSDELGPRVYSENDSQVFLGRDMITHRNLSNATAEKVDREVTRIVDQQYARAREILQSNTDKVEAMAGALLEWETISAEQIDDIMAGRQPRPPAPEPEPETKSAADAGAGGEGGGESEGEAGDETPAANDDGDAQAAAADARLAPERGRGRR